MNRLVLASAAALLAAVPALAHHSFAMFDQRRIMTLEGTVTEFQWTVLPPFGTSSSMKACGLVH